MRSVLRFMVRRFHTGLSRRKRRGTRESFEHLYQFVVTWGVANGLGQFLWHQRIGVLADDLSVFAVEIRIFQSLAHRLLNDLHPIFRRSRRQNVGRACQSENSRDGEELDLFFRLSEALDLREVAEA